MKTPKIASTTRGDQFNIDTRLIEIVEGFNVRQEFDKEEMKSLTDSIRENGVRVPILVKKHRGEERYTLVNGERRVRACLWLLEQEGLVIRVPATKFDGNDVDAIVDNLITNDGVPLSLLEQAEAVMRLVKHNLTDKEIAQKTSRSLSVISNLKMLNEAPQKIKKMIAEQAISSTLVMSIMRENKKDMQVGFDAIEKAVQNLPISGKTRVTSQTIQRQEGKVNSMSELRHFMASFEDDQSRIITSKQDLFDFCRKLVRNELTFSQIEASFLN